MGTRFLDSRLHIRQNRVTADEISFVRAKLQTRFGLAIAQRSDRTQPITASNIFNIARLNKIANFLGDISADESGEPFAQELSSLVRDYRQRTIALNSATLQTMRRAVEALDDTGVEFMLFKGPLQQHLLYESCFAKPSGDVDILVYARHFDRARDALAEIGFSIETRSKSLWWRLFLGEQHLVRPEPRATIDLHHRLQQPGSPSPLAMRAFFDRRQRVELAGASVPSLSLHDVALVAAISVTKALFNREPSGGYVCDLHASLTQVPDSEIDVFVAEAERQGLLPTLLFGVRTVDALLGASSQLSDRAQRILPDIPGSAILEFVITPWQATSRWPRRRAVLWELCDKKIGRYVSESAWASLSEIGRRLFYVR